jgi:Ca2+-binding RTX toxin-like protein
MLEAFRGDSAMTTVNVSDIGFIDLTTLALVGDSEDQFPAYHDEEIAVVGFLDAAYVFKGTGFTEFDEDGYMENGTVNEWQYWAGGEPLLVFSDFSVRGAKLQQAFSEGDVEFFLQLMFSGDDHFLAGKAGASFQGRSGNDLMEGRNAADTFSGGEGDDTLVGGGGDDILIGGKGLDTLSGDGGNDTFRYFTTDASHGNNADTITDLRAGDLVVLEGIDADESDAGDDDFVVVASFSGAAGELTLDYKRHDDRTELKADTDGDSNADLLIYITGRHVDPAFIDL